MKRLLFFLLLILLAACTKSPAPPRVEEALGTVCSVNAFEDGTTALYDELFARLSEIEAKFSVNKAHSDISAINAAAGESAVTVDKEVFAVLQKALDVCQASDGAFDPTIGPLVTLWGINTDKAHVPTDAEITAAKTLVNHHDCVLLENDTKVFLRHKGMSLDLGGIAKGYAADELVKILRTHRVRRAIIDLGGNIYVFGKKADGSPWRVGIKNPADPWGDSLLVLEVGETSVVTSGVYERFFEQDGIRYHHILDSRTGYPVQNGLASVTVVCQSSLLADALSTTLFALGKEKGIALAKQYGVRVVFVDENGKIIDTQK